nr:hypothetical protein [Tanacetum cinerariifolium]
MLLVLKQPSSSNLIIRFLCSFGVDDVEDFKEYTLRDYYYWLKTYCCWYKLKLLDNAADSRLRLLEQSDVADDKMKKYHQVLTAARIGNVANAEPTPPSPTLAITPPPSQELPSTSQVAPTLPPSPIAPPSSPPQQQKPLQPSHPTTISMDLLHTLLETCTTLTRRVENLEQDKIAQALEITKRMHPNRGIIALIDTDKDVTLEEVDAAKDTKVAKDVDVQERLEESQAQVYHIDLEHADKVLSMQDDKAEPTELTEVSEVVTTAKLMTKVVTTAAFTIIVAPSTARRRKGVVIRDPKETATPSTIVHSEPKSKDKGKGILVEEPKPLKNQAQIKQDKAYARELKGTQRKSKSSEKKATKKQKLDEEVEELKKHLQIVPNDEDDVYTEATPLALKVSVVDYQIHTEHNKPYYNIIRADVTHQIFLSFLSLLRNFDREDLEMLWQIVQEKFASSKPKNFSDDFLLTTLKAMFEKPDVKAQVCKNPRGIHDDLASRKKISLDKIHSRSNAQQFEKRFGGNKETNKVQKTLLKQQYKNFTGSSSESLDQIHDWLQKMENSCPNLEEQDRFGRSKLDDLFNSLKIYDVEVKSSSTASPTTQDIAFVSSQNPDSTNETVSDVANVSTASTKVPISTLHNVDTLSDAVIYSFFASQSNSPQLDNDDLKQIDADDLEEMDLKWQMAMLTMRARRFLQRTRRNIGANGTTSIGFDMSKVEWYNCHGRGHFARECRSPKDTRRNVPIKTQRRNVPVETSTSNALVSQCDGVGSYDWSFQAKEEPTNYALMAFISSSSSSSDNEVASCSKACLESIEARLLVYQQNKTIFEEDIKLLKLDVELRDNDLVALRKKFETTEQERDELKLKLNKFPTSSKNLRTFMPPKPDLVFYDAPTVNKTVHTAFNVELSPIKPDKYLSQSNRPSVPLIEDWVSDSGDDSEGEPMHTQITYSFVQPTKQVNTPRPSVKIVEHPIPADNLRKDIPKSKSHSHRRNRKACFVFLTGSRLVPVTIIRPVTTAIPHNNVTRPRPAKTVVTKSHLPPRRTINHRSLPKPRKALVDNDVTTHTIASEMLKINMEPLAPKLLNNRTTHSDYLRLTQEQAVILREVVEQGKSQNSLNNSLDSTLDVTLKNKDKRVRFTEPVTSSGNTNTKTTSSSNLVSNKPMLSSTRVKLSTSASGSQPSGNTKKDWIQQPPSSTQKNKHSTLNVNFKLICVKCNGYMLFDNHDLCINDVNACPKSKSVKKTSKRKEWKPTGKVFTKTGYTWRPDGWTFTIVGNACPLTRITTTTEVPPRKPNVLENDTPKPVVTLVYSRKPRKSKTNVPISKPKIIKSISANNKEPSKSWGYIVFDVPSSSIDECRSSKLFSGWHLYETSVARSPQQNGFVERRNRTLIEVARTMLIYAKALLFLWAEVFRTHTKPSPLTTYVPQSRTNWDLLFQPMFDELLNPPPSVDPPSPEVIDRIAEVIAPEPAALIGSPSSTTIDQDAPSPSNSQTSPKTQSLVISNDVKEENHDLDVAHMNNDPFFGISIPESIFKAFLSLDVIPTVVYTTEFLNGILRKEVYVSQPDWFVDKDNRNHVYKLKKALYGLKQAHLACMESSDPVDTPMVEKSNLDEDPQEKAVDPTHYREMVGTFMYLTASKPDLTFVVCMCARYQAKPTKKHLHAVKRIFKYLRGTVNSGLWCHTPPRQNREKMRIEQYFLMTDYSLLEVILNGDSPVSTRVIDGVVQPVAPTTAEQRLAKKNELKARDSVFSVDHA